MVISDELADYMNAVGRYGLLSADEERRLLCLYHDKSAPEADRAAAYEELITCNLRLVMAVVKKYAYSGVCLMDLIQSGNLGLIIAIQRFDNSKANRLAAYATWWIRLYVQDELSRQQNTMRCPSSMKSAYRKIKRARKKLTQELGRDPNSREICEIVEDDSAFHNRQLENQYKRLQKKMNLNGCLTEKEQACLDEVNKARFDYRRKQIEIISATITQRGISLDSAVESSDIIDGSSILDSIPDSSRESPEEHAIRTISTNQMYELVENVLDEKEKYVIRHCYGLDGVRNMTIAELAEVCNLPVSKVNQIKLEAINKMKLAAGEKAA